MQQLILGFAFSTIISLISYRARSLSRSGAYAAVLSGGLIFGLGGLPWATLLLVFFISSSLLSRLFSRQKTGLGEKFSKGSRRDWGQVLANGGLGALLAVANALLPEQFWQWVAFAGAMAAVNADTWATELGVLNRTPPRLITTRQVVERGASGGVSLLGTLSGLGGATLIALFGAVFYTQEALPPGDLPVFLFAVILGGMAGTTFDSLLGATVQAIYYCPVCRKETERHPTHSCGTATKQVRGWHWLDNDLVNIACSLAGALAAVGIWLILER